MRRTVKHERLHLKSYEKLYYQYKKLFEPYSGKTFKGHDNCMKLIEKVKKLREQFTNDLTTVQRNEKKHVNFTGVPRSGINEHGIEVDRGTY